LFPRACASIYSAQAGAFAFHQFPDRRRASGIHRHPTDGMDIADRFGTAGGRRVHPSFTAANKTTSQSCRVLATQLAWSRPKSQLPPGITREGKSARTNVSVPVIVLSPDRPRGLHHAPQLRALIRLTQRIAGRTARESALRTDRKPVEIDMAGGFFRPALQAVQAFEHGSLAADQAQHHALAFRHEAQRREIP